MQQVDPDLMWNRDEALSLCYAIEQICPPFGCHVALTGGLLYKAGQRKDADILFYRIRQINAIDLDGLFAALVEIGVNKTSGFGWVHKAEYGGKKIDFFFPEAPDGEYEHFQEEARIRAVDVLEELLGTAP